MGSKFKTKIRTATKSQESELIDKAKRLSEDPLLILPKCKNENCKCYFLGIKNKLKKISENKDNKLLLSWYANSWFSDALSKAYAGTLLLAIEKKASRLAVVNFPFADITYAVRGKAKKEKLVAVQNYDDKRLRLLGVVELSKKKDIAIYSMDEKMLCTGKERKPPKEFIDEVMEELKLIEKKEGIFCCGHVEENVRKTSLELDWFSAKTKIIICENCANENTFERIARYILDNKIKYDFDVSVNYKLKCLAECKNCFLDIKVEKELKEKYKNAEINDKELIISHVKNVKEELKFSEEKLYIDGEKCYGGNIELFINSLNPTKEERTALNILFKKINAVVLEKPSVNKILEEYWEEHGKEILQELIKNKELAEEIFSKANIGKESISSILKNASKLAEEYEIISSLPKYKKLPIIAKIGDEVAKAFKTKGKEKALQILDKYKEEDMKVKSLVFAFLTIFKEEKNRRWRYSEIEVDFSKHLILFCNELLNAKGEDYHNALQELLRQSGFSEEIESE